MLNRYVMIIMVVAIVIRLVVMVVAMVIWVVAKVVAMFIMMVAMVIWVVAKVVAYGHHDGCYGHLGG